MAKKQKPPGPIKPIKRSGPRTVESAAPAPKPLIMAPAGGKASFLAAVAAGADAVYCGLKRFSARMEAENFTPEDLVSLTRLAHARGVKVFVTLNSLLRPDELDEAGRLVEILERSVKADALIIQDLSLIRIAREAGFSGELHLSTLANAGFPRALKMVRGDLGIDRVVLPRELNVDEIKALASACPTGLFLEVFVHGALCYGVSGRCYWSSFLGGKSGLRGRCVQPCRRMYTHRERTGRIFSCQDLSLDVLSRILLQIPQVRGWKIEGRKKGPHYVYYTVSAYRELRDNGDDPAAKKNALELLARALGRRGTHYNFLPQRPQQPIAPGKETGSGLFVGRVQGGGGNLYLSLREELLPGDILRIGYEDVPGHGIHRVVKYVPKSGRYDLKGFSGKPPASGSPVFLIDRREDALVKILSGLEAEMARLPAPAVAPSGFTARLPVRSGKRVLAEEVRVYRYPFEDTPRRQTGLWLSPKALEMLPHDSGDRFWWWLPPVVWPEEEERLKDLIVLALRKKSRNFVLNAPWQTGLFRLPKGLNLWAGPFCNAANPLALEVLAEMGYSGAIVSPELDRDTYISLPRRSPLPIGIVLSAFWPLCVSRTVSEDLKVDAPFTSPKGEQGWVRRYGSDFWVFPNWKLDITEKRDELKLAGYALFVHLLEQIPHGVAMKKRPGLWNWDLSLQ